MGTLLRAIFSLLRLILHLTENGAHIIYLTTFTNIYVEVGQKVGTDRDDKLMFNFTWPKGYIFLVAIALIYMASITVARNGLHFGLSQPERLRIIQTS